MRKLGSVDVLDSFKDEKAPWAIIFHGYGADAFDLFQLNDVIPVSKPLNWIFPQGIKEVPIGPGWTGRAWWDIDVESLQRAAMSGVERDLSLETNHETPAVRKKILGMIDALKVPWDQIILGGFSQGGMLAMDIFMHAPQEPRGLVIWSSALVNKEEWKARAQSEEYKKRREQKPNFKYFQSHGTSDSVLTIKNGQRLESFLQSIGGKGKMVTFAGAHEIPPAAILGTSQYLNEII
jgi:phospholipase/carboxylesterase